jgi:predicted RNA-binding Zn ribbon-like protein
MFDTSMLTIYYCMLVSVVVNRDFARPADEDLLVAFANTGHAGPDQLDDVADMRSWASSMGLLASIPRTDTGEDLELLRRIREAVRAMLLAHNGGPAEPDLSPLEAVPLRLVTGERLGVRAVDSSTTTAVVVGAIASAILVASARPTWSRLKACPGPDCAWVFRDQTRNGSRRWCQMSECGNRAKGAAFRARAGRRR